MRRLSLLLANRRFISRTEFVPTRSSGALWDLDPKFILSWVALFWDPDPRLILVLSGVESTRCQRKFDIMVNKYNLKNGEPHWSCLTCGPIATLKDWFSFNTSQWGPSLFYTCSICIFFLFFYFYLQYFWFWYGVSFSLQKTVVLIGMNLLLLWALKQGVLSSSGHVAILGVVVSV